jgi:hypothetical protein
MANKHEAREPGTKFAVWARSESGTARLPLSTLSPLFCTKTCFLARFFRVKRAGPPRLGLLRVRLRQTIKHAGLADPTRFSNRVWRAGLKTDRASPGRAGRPVWPSLTSLVQYQYQYQYQTTYHLWNYGRNTPWACLFRLLAASGHQKLLQTAKRSAFQPASIKFVGAKTIQNQHKHIIG